MYSPPALIVLLAACTTPDLDDDAGASVRADPGAPSDTELDTGGGPDTDADTDMDADTDTDGDPDTDTPAPCPAQMVEIDGRFCIDRAEAALEEWDGDGWVTASPYETVGSRRVRAVVAWSAVPQGYISGDEAEAACLEAGKRLCTSDEWIRACEGSEGRTWPYGDTHIEGACNDDYEGGHPLIDYFGTSEGIWDSAHMNDPGINQQAGTVAPGGAFAACESEDGVFDLHGNLHEWVADGSGVFRGGFYADASINGDGCGYRTTAHSRSYHDYSTGFRCSQDPLERGR